MKKYSFKKLIGFLHLWLGLFSGIIVFIVAVTGCLYAFQEEIQNYTETYRFVESEENPFLLPSQLEKIARKEFPNKSLHAIEYKGPNEAAEAIFFHYEPTYYHIIYLNPYSGEVLQNVNMEEGFFSFILDGHYYLWLPHEIGQIVVASATLIFLILLLTGLYLWYPKNKNARKQRFSFKWKKSTRWKRKNYDLHNVTGFYIMAIALIFAITGLIMGFNWFASSYYTLLGGEKSLVYLDPVSKPRLEGVSNPLDKVWLKMRNEYPQAKTIEVHPPENENSPIAANANPDEGTYWKIDYRYYDQYTLEEKEVKHIFGRYNDAAVSDKLMRMNYDIHTGAVLGLAGKIFAFLISLMIATLPITGFCIWWNRKFKQKK
ncbi:PepSY-associated TM helix domain-containing protein [Flavobacterium algicola]|uniref:PepSY-associated TM helix domain-containing protein n=1 Tax=Flavobacterium algicola TaxID=556529 RepID=UPI001EFDC5C6|nr:PepSY-associated TM helix domain-containing protein [Flavobacterium algicola]MCG9792535.1 PepSY domain-containing protein [Flavobacterium algicola]